MKLVIGLANRFPITRDDSFHYGYFLMYYVLSDNHFFRWLQVCLINYLFRILIFASVVFKVSFGLPILIFPVRPK